MTARIEVTGLRKAFAGRAVLDGVGLAIPAGASTVLLGGSGSGKSVLLKCLLGLIAPDAGRIAIDGQDLAALSTSARRAARDRIGMLFQQGALFDSLPVWENICFKLLAQRRIPRAAGRERAAALLAQVGLDAALVDQMPGALSGGMQKRVALARAVAAEPDILFFDEPTTGLDPVMGAVIDDLIVDCVRRLGATAFSITHDIASARRIGDQAAMLQGGRIVWTGAAAALGSTGHAVVDRFARGERAGPVAAGG